MGKKKVKGNILNPFSDEIYAAEILIQKGIIKCVKPIKEDLNGYILPGFIDAHIHIESSMLTPSRFAQAVVPHGTTSVVSDPHEIANVMGLAGIEYMIKDAASVPLNFFYTAPSCVPATPFETSGAIIDAEKIGNLLQNEGIVALGEVMNFPGVLTNDNEVMAKIEMANKFKKPIDGHAPLLSGSELCKYIEAGISTDHECTTPEEVVEKRNLGMKVMLREGSSAENLAELVGFGGDFIVSDDKHPSDLLRGHMDVMLKKAVELGLDPLEAVKMVTINPGIHYNLNRGMIAPGKVADLVYIEDLDNFNVKKVYINGFLVSKDGKVFFPVKPLQVQSTFKLNPKNPEDFQIFSKNDFEVVRVIEIVDGQLLTKESESRLKVEKGKIKSDLKNDILNITVLERYGHNKISNAFVKGFKLQKGAIASSIVHDSHNIIVVGTNSVDMAKAAEILVKNKGGLVVVSEDNHKSLKLEVAGLMSTKKVNEVSYELDYLQEMVSDLGCKLHSPFMTLSFLALLVIPHLKISDRGLFDVGSFKFVPVIKKFDG